MRKSRFTDEQIIAILAEQERGLATSEVCRRHGISLGTFYIYGLLPRGKKDVVGSDDVDCRHLSGVT